MIRKAVLLLCLCACHAFAWAADLAVVIDDVGYNKARGMRAIHLPGPVSLAVLPFAPHTQALLQHASAVGKDIIVHQPMEAHPSAHARLEKDTLTLAMSSAQLNAQLARALAAVPQRLGVSNHTGSLLTQHPAPMRQLMLSLRQHNLFFLDSRTTADTVAVQVAREVGVLAMNRDVFLDHTRTPAAIRQAFNRAVQLARRNGSAILVGHPYQQSLAFLEQQLTALPGDVRLVGLRELAAKRQATLARQQRQGSPHISLGQ